jgi:aminopeptidase N
MRYHWILLLLWISWTGIKAQQLPMQQTGCCKASFAKSLLKAEEIHQSPLLFDYDVSFYFLDLQVENNSIDIAGNVTINAEIIAEQADTFAFELVDELMIDSIWINQLNHPFLRNNNEVFVPLTEPIGQGGNISAKIYYNGTPPSGGFFSGISTAYDSAWNKHVTWTLSEPFNARQWWPVKQDLNDKADSVWVFITTSNTNKVGSQGLLTNITTLPDEKLRYEWKSNYPIDYYLISFAVSEYQEYNIYAHPLEMQDDSILIQNYIYDVPGCLENYKTSIDRTSEFLELFSDLYSLYPFHEEKYGHCLTAMGGGMEHQTMSSMGYFGFGIVAHELGHMWFGDNVTCASWSDIWINEGFATYSDFLAHEFVAGDPWPLIWMEVAHDIVMKEPDGSVYIPANEIAYDNVERIFDGRLSYYKGAVIIHMIRYELQNDNLFFEVLQNFQAQFKDSVASGIDFLNVLNETSYMDFSEFFDQWYFGEGYPIYDINWVQDNNILQIHAQQTTSMPQVTPFFKIHMPYKMFFNDGTDTTVHLLQEASEMEFTFSFDKTIDSIQLDPEKWVLKKVAFMNNLEENTEKLPFHISPNPAHDKFFIHFHKETTNPYILQVFNTNGTLVKKQPVSIFENQVVISNLTSGLYLIEISDGIETCYSKLLIQNL